MALYKKEVLVRPNSTISETDALKWTQNWLNQFQDADENKDEDGNYINYFFGDVFFAKNKKIWRVFSDACETKYSMQKDPNLNMIAFTILDAQNLENRIEALEATDGDIEVGVI